MFTLNKRIKCFLEVASCLNFSVAAEHLYLTQQAVTYQISELEKDLGVTLLVRTTRSVSLTEAGRLLRDEFLKISRQADASIELVQNLGYEDHIAVTIGFFTHFSRSRVIVPMLETLRHRFPNVVFVVKMYDFAELRNHLLDGELDLCVTSSYDWRNWPRVEASVLSREPFEIACSRNHPLARIPKPTMEDLSRYNMLALPADIIVGQSHLESKIPHKRFIQLPDLATLLVYLESGAGFALLSRVFSGACNGAFHFAPTPFDPMYADTICAYRSNMLSPLVRSIAQTIRKTYKYTCEIPVLPDGSPEAIIRD